MNKQYLYAILDDISTLAPNLPAEALGLAAELKRIMDDTTEAQFEQMTDGAVTEAPYNQSQDGQDARYKVYELYASINGYMREHRGSDQIDEQTVSIANRLQGLIDAYDRDFP